MTAPLAPIRRRTSWTVEHEAAVAGVTVVPLPEPMPVTVEELSGLRRGIVWGLAVTCPFWAVLFAATVVWAMAR